MGPPKKYEPNWFSIGRHPLPKWFDDAKLGIFIHWGLYSVPAWAPPTGELGKVDFKQWFTRNPYAEWYLNTMKIKESPTWKHHVETYGETFDYLQFAETFNKEARKWKPEEWAALFKEAGAKYAVLTTKHHDGFTLWPSRVPNPHRKPEHTGTERDLVGELSQAVRAQGLKMGLYYSGGLDWSFVGTPIVTFMDLMKTVPQSEEYARYADAHWRELIERYQPAVLWNDINYPKKGDLLNIFADYYTKYPDGLINNRFGVAFADFTTPEYAKYDRITEKKWESCRGLGFSFGYNRAEGPEHVLSADKLIDMLVDIVSKNGNLLLNIGPKPDGSISELQVDRLKALGKWLAQNGDAIYETRPWVRPSAKTADGGEVRFTKKGDAVYVILLDKPKSAQVTIQSLLASDKMTVALLGSSGALQWSQQGRDLAVTLPSALPGDHAWALKMTPAPWQVVKE
jgi:alpha-L-fucosidase